MKGLELPVNMIVVIAIAVLVLVVVAAFFVNKVNPNELNLETAFNSGCNTLRSAYNCQVSGISSINVRGFVPSGVDSAAYPSGYPFGGADGICARKGFTEDQCARVCGC